jgi:hypothetical protein
MGPNLKLQPIVAQIWLAIACCPKFQLAKNIHFIPLVRLISSSFQLRPVINLTISY